MKKMTTILSVVMTCLAMASVAKAEVKCVDVNLKSIHSKQVARQKLQKHYIDLLFSDQDEEAATLKNTIDLMNQEIDSDISCAMENWSK